MRERIQKPLTLPQEIVELLRGQRGYAEDCAVLAELAIDYYQDGKVGQFYDVPEAPAFDPRAVELTERFLLACWEQGREDAGTK